jgi:PAS domain S-box-containing protein
MTHARAESSLATTRRPWVSRSVRHQWLLLGGVLIAVGALAIWSRASDFRDLSEDQRLLLASQALAIDENLSSQLTGAAGALRGVRADLASWPAEGLTASASRRLNALSDAMPGVRTMLLLDRDGRVLASSRPELTGRDFGDRAYFRQVREQPDPARLWLSAPFVSSLGVYSMNLSIAVLAADGSFAGVVTATLDAEYFRTLMHATLYARDMWASVAHGDGQVLMFEPPRDDLAGFNLDQPGSFFRRHRDTGQVASVMTGMVTATGEQRMMALRKVQPAGLSMDKPIMVAVSRELDAMLAPWWRQTWAYAGLYVMIILATSGTLLAMQRRQRAIERLEDERAERERKSAERLELALRGADLGLWDLDLVTGASYVSERWNSMLGLPHQAVHEGSVAWSSRVHPEDWRRVMAAQDAHLNGHTERYEQVYRMQHADGHWIWIQDRAQVLERDPSGKPLRMVGTHMDITQTMQWQLALERSEQRLATTLQSIGDAVISTDAQGGVVQMNATAEQLTGWRTPDASGQPLASVFRVFDAHTREPVVDPVRRVIDGGAIVGHGADVAVLQSRDGREYQIAASAAPIRSPGGEVTGVVLVFSDVTERYRIQEALRANEERLRLLLDNLSAGVVIHGPDAQVIEANPAALRMLGLSLDQLRGKAELEPGWVLLEEDETPMAFERYPVNQVRSSHAALQSFTVGLRRPDRDRPVWALCNAFALRSAQGQPTLIVVTLSDITDRKEAENRLRDSEDLKTAVIDSLTAHIAVLDRQGVIIAVNEAWRRFAQENGAPERFVDPVGLSYLGVCTPPTGAPFGEEASEAMVGLRAVLAGEQAEFQLEYPCHSPLEQRWFRMSVTRMRGARAGVVVSHISVTELKLAEQRILATQGELQATLQAVPDLMFELSLEGRIHNFHSPRRELLYGEPDGFLGKAMPEILPPDAAAVVMQALHQAHEAGFSSGLQYELPLDGGPHWFEASVARKPVPEGEAPRFILLARDVTERRLSELERQALEARLRDAQRVESIGTLAGGIAHDFNNILAAILGNVAMAREDAAKGHSVLESLDQINRAGLRARHLVQQILTFSRREHGGLTTQLLGPMVEETLELLRATLPAGVRLDAVVPEAPLAVRSDSTQLQQVLMNLCTNAWHALPEQGGRIEVGFERVVADDSLRHRLPNLPEGIALAHLWVRDNGRGIDPTIVGRVFDPFFTTKPVGQGTGLGLSVVHGIVRAHDGAISVDTAPGEGSIFHVYLPSPPLDAIEPAGHAPSAAPVQGEGQHVLYVDDDEVMVVMVERMLLRAGFRVSVETDAAAALAQVRAHPQAFDAVVTDFNMPELSGLEVAAELARIRPDLPVVISSGYVSDLLRRQAAVAGVRALINKERTVEELAALLHELLTGDPG